VQIDYRNRLSNFWAPTGGISAQDGEHGKLQTIRSDLGANNSEDESYGMLIRAGFLRQVSPITSLFTSYADHVQAHSGVFHLLPLGLRVQNKLENLIDKHMSSLGASKVSLSSISTEALWRQSGRYSANSELLRLNDRRESGFLLSPTHEEEITSLVAGMVHSYKDLPLRLYQIGRKYRDERRPRGGLLRAKEFLMKDLYTFDYSPEHGLQTYEAVRTAYKNLFDELKIPYLVADADSGNMGGKLSHEYHFVSPKGEDDVWSCNSCDYVANEELVEKKPDARKVDPNEDPNEDPPPMVLTGISTDRTTAVKIHILRPSFIPSHQTLRWDQTRRVVNLHAAKRFVDSMYALDLDTGIETDGLNNLLPKTTKTVNVYDISMAPDVQDVQTANLQAVHNGAGCPRCADGKLSVQKAIEVGHTFHLGTRYSEPLNALVRVSGQKHSVPMEMGCHGIGVSRLIGAIASLLANDKGLNWPRVVSPFEVVILPGPKVSAGDCEEIYDQFKSHRGLEVDAVLDDRKDKELGWKLKDADLIGYPIIIVLGRSWRERREVEVQCKRLGVKMEVGLEQLRQNVVELLAKL
jgi:prolyl-tRNA synthetase